MTAKAREMRPAEVRLRLGAFLAGALGLILGGTGAILQSLGFAGWPVAVIGAIVASTGLVVFVLDHARETQQRREESERAAATRDAELRRLVRFWPLVQATDAELDEVGVFPFGDGEGALRRRAGAALRRARRRREASCCPRPGVSKHLRVLREVGAVDVRDEGRQRLYRLNGHALKPIHDWVKTHERSWSERFDQLDVVLEELKHKEEGDGRDE